MRQDSRLEPPTQLSPAMTMLHPVLSSALAHLDIQLEDELARYRRQQTGTGRAARQPSRKRSPESLDLIAVSGTAHDHSTAAPPTPVLEERLTDIAEPSIALGTYKPIPAFTATPQPFDGAIALRPSAKPLNHDGDADSTLGGENAYALAQAANPNLDDYLESSEELLRSLADEQAEVQAERNFMRSLLTPLGLGAMLLLLLSSAMFGYVIMNPSTLSWLTAKQNNSGSSPPGSNGGTTAIAPPSYSSNPVTKPELPELSLNNLGTATVKSGKSGSTSSTAPGTQTPPTPGSKPMVPATTSAPSQPSREPAAAAQPLSPAATSSSRRSYPRTEAPQPAPSIAPSPVAPPVRRVPTAAPSVAASQRTGVASSSYQYKVGIPFENDQTLENARKVVPDAFVRTLPDGRTIVQVGAARDEAEGRANVQKLRDQGLSSSEVYKR